MNHKKQVFAVVILYSEISTHSARDRSYKENSPFSARGRLDVYNDSYGYFLLECKKRGLKAAFVSSADIIGPGLFQSYWTFDKKWKRNYGQAYADLIFDKYSPATVYQKKKMARLISTKSVNIFNNQKLKDIFRDKLNTYQNFDRCTIPTVSIKDFSKHKIFSAKRKLDKLSGAHKYKADFGEKYILKDQKGASGRKIYQIDFEHLKFIDIWRQYKIDKKNKTGFSYVLQSFINCDRGFVIGKYAGLIDLRVIVLNNEIIQTYLRIAQKGSFLCNEHQGGELVYITKSDIPSDVLKMAGKIIRQIKLKLNAKHCLYALDFIRSNNGNLYFIEGNSNPGLDWDHRKKINEIKTKKLIRLIVGELASLALKN